MSGLPVVLMQAHPPTLEVTAIPSAARDAASVGFNPQQLFDLALNALSRPPLRELC
jgi:hypothetical protein